VIRYLVDELWDGEQFLARVIATGELYKCGCAAQLQPVLLGKRLPKAIVRKIRDRVLDETEFLTDYGITSENISSPLFTMHSFTRGPVIAPVNMLILSGLYDAGEKEAARKIARRFLQALMIHGPVLGVSPFRRDPGTYKQLNDYAQNQIGNPVTAWGASVFLALAGRFFK
jgi:glycogen debranching enzyme